MIISLLSLQHLATLYRPLRFTGSRDDSYVTSCDSSGWYHTAPSGIFIIHFPSNTPTYGSTYGLMLLSISTSYTGYYTTCYTYRYLDLGILYYIQLLYLLGLHSEGSPLTIYIPGLVHYPLLGALDLKGFPPEPAPLSTPSIDGSWPGLPRHSVLTFSFSIIPCSLPRGQFDLSSPRLPPIE